MANDISRRTHRIDTDSTNLIITETVVIETVRWVSALAQAADQAIIRNAADEILWESVANEANYVERDVVDEIAIGGYKVSVLTSGALFIRIRRAWEVAHGR